MIQKLQEYVSQYLIPRTYFERCIKNKEEIITALSKYDISQQHNNLEKDITYILTDKDFLDVYKIELLFRIKDNSIKLIREYLHGHLINSIITDILYKTEYQMIQRVYATVYELYYYWFFNISENSKMNLNVCCDIENIIAIIIDKQLTLYRECPTEAAIEHLREALKKERMTAIIEERSRKLRLR